MAEPFMQAIDWNNDSTIGNIGKFYQNVDTALDTGPAWANALSYMLPVIGTARTFGDAAENFGQAFNGDGTWEADEVGSFFRGLGDLGLGALSIIPGAGFLGSAVGKGAKLLGKAVPKSVIQGAKTGDSGLKGTMARLAEFGKIGDKTDDGVESFGSIMRSNKAARYADRISDAETAANNANNAVTAAQKAAREAQTAVEEARAGIGTARETARTAREAARTATREQPFLSRQIQSQARRHGNEFSEPERILASAETFISPDAAAELSRQAARRVREAGRSERAATGRLASANDALASAQRTQQGAGAALENLRNIAGSSATADVMDALTALSEFWKGTEGLGRGARAGVAGTRALLADLLNGGNYDEDYYAVESPATAWLL